MFLENRCERCGTCLVECMYIKVTEENAINDIFNMIETREPGDILKNCIVCPLIVIMFALHSQILVSC